LEAHVSVLESVSCSTNLFWLQWWELPAAHVNKPG